MQLVIDANPFIAGFLRDSASRRIILSEKVVLFSPSWLLEEFQRNEPVLKNKFPSSSNFSETKDILLRFIKIVPKAEYAGFISEASRLAKHVKDVPYFALALHLNCPIWSEEKSFKSQTKVRVHSTSEMVKEFGL